MDFVGFLFDLNDSFMKFLAQMSVLIFFDCQVWCFIVDFNDNPCFYLLIICCVDYGSSPNFVHYVSLGCAHEVGSMLICLFVFPEVQMITRD